jgi:hypothetical protein
MRNNKVMSYLNRLGALVLIAALAALFCGTKAVGSQATHKQTVTYQRVLSDRACPVRERIGYIFQAGAIDALVKIGTAEALKAVELYRVH